MVVQVLDQFLEEQLKAERKESGADRWDEVWEGVYVIAPLPDNRHQEIVGKMGCVIYSVLGWSESENVYLGINVSDQAEDWEYNYRIPDVAVFLKGTTACNRHTHWFGGPDFAVDIITPGDRSREKIPFYARVGTRELLLVDRDPWVVELYQLRTGQLQQVGRSTLDQSATLASAVLPLTFQLVPADQRPGIEVTHLKDGQRWTV